MECICPVFFNHGGSRPSVFAIYGQGLATLLSIWVTNYFPTSDVRFPSDETSHASHYSAAETYLGDPKGPVSGVCLTMESEDGGLSSFRRKVNRPSFRVGGTGGVACSHFY